MKPILVATLALTALGACSQRDLCLSDASRDLRTVSALADSTRANIERGYAIGKREEIVTRRERCTIALADGQTARGWCKTPETRTRTFPVAIDLNVERAKLRSLEAKLTELRSRTARQQQECLAQYPE